MYCCPNPGAPQYKGYCEGHYFDLNWAQKVRDNTLH